MSYDAEQNNLFSLKKVYAEKAQRTVFFLGAGASVEAGLPTWQSLREGLHELISATVTGESDDIDLENFRELEEIKDSDDFWRYFDFSKNNWPTTYSDYLESAIDIEWSDVSTPIVYKKIWDMDNVNQIVTLNIDGLIFRAFEESKRANHKILVQYDGYSVTDSKPYFSRDVCCLLNLHGTIFQRSRWIMNEEERRRLYEGESKKRYSSFLTWLFQNHNIVFIGLNAKDVAIKNFLDLASETGILEKHFWICPSPDSETKRWAEKNSIRLIQYYPDVDDKGVSIHSTDICSILDDVEKFVSADRPVELPITIEEEGVENLASPNDLISLLSSDRDRAISKLSACATFLGRKHGFTSSQMNKFVEEMALPIQFAASFDSKIEPFDRLLGYRIVDKIQGGGSSSVWMCLHQDCASEYFVIKSLNGTSHGDETERQSFRRGIESMYLLNRAGIDVCPKYFYHFELPLSVVMEYIPGSTLSEVIQSSVLTNSLEKVKLFEGICRSVRMCHSSDGSVLHRDIKPGNVIFKNWFVGYDVGDLFDTHIKFINFDLSWHRYSSGNTKSIGADEVGYYAPEQKGSRNSPPPRTAKTDVYMLGMLMYYIISGENPPEGGARLLDWAELVEKRVAVSFDVPIIRERLTRLILSMTSVDLESRPDTESILSDIRNIFEFSAGNFDAVDHDFIVENIMSSLGKKYSWDDRKMEGKIHTTLNANLTFRYVHQGMKCELSFNRAREESANRGSFGGQINRRIQEVRQTLTDSGWNCEIGGGSIKTLRAEMPVRVLARKERLGVDEISVLSSRLLSSLI